MIWHALLVFLNAIVIDIVWAFYIRRTSEGKAHQAALAAAGTISFGAFNGISFVENPWLIIPGALGAYLGTYFTVRKDRKGSK